MPADLDALRTEAHALMRDLRALLLRAEALEAALNDVAVVGATRERTWAKRVDVVLRQGGPRSVTELVTVLGVKLSVLRTTLYRMEKAGTVVRSGNRWRVRQTMVTRGR